MCVCVCGNVCVDTCGCGGKHHVELGCDTMTSWPGMSRFTESQISRLVV